MAPHVLVGLCLLFACSVGALEDAVDWTVAFTPKSERLKNRQRYRLHIPRVTAAELEANSTLMSGHLPFVVVGAMEGWSAMEKWRNLRYLSQKVPLEWVDYYKANMYSRNDKPFLFKMREATEYFLEPSETGLPRYMQLRLGVNGWKELEKDLFKNGTEGRYLPGAMWGETDWIQKCMPDPKDVDNFYRVNQWNMLLIGETGTGIFLHHDHLAASSWQAHIVGRKAWVICPYDQSKFLSKMVLDLLPWDPDYKRFPEFAKAHCGRVIAEPGDLLYYPAYWYHTTKCLDSPTIGLTGLMVGVEDKRRDISFEVHKQFLLDLQKKCKAPGEDISKKWPGAAPPISPSVCAVLPACFELWNQHVKDIGERYTTENPYADHAAKGAMLEAAGDIAGAVLSYRAAARHDDSLLENWINLQRILSHKDNPDLGSETNTRLLKLCKAQQKSFQKRNSPLEL